MGYRNYLYVVDKAEYEKFKALTYDQAVKKFSDGFDDHISSYDFMDTTGFKRLMEFGKYIDWTDKIKPYFKDVFDDKKLEEYFNQEEEFKVLDQAALEVIARDVFVEKIKEYYNKLSEEKSLDYLHQLAKNKVTEWNTMNTKPCGKWQLNTSWQYEYEYFNLLNIMNQLDPKKHILFWLGY